MNTVFSSTTNMFLFFKGMDFKGKPTVSHDSDWDGCGEEAEFCHFSESCADPKEGRPKLNCLHKWFFLLESTIFF
jgi:hypothetical protein